MERVARLGELLRSASRGGERKAGDELPFDVEVCDSTGRFQLRQGDAKLAKKRWMPLHRPLVEKPAGYRPEEEMFRALGDMHPALDFVDPRKVGPDEYRRATRALCVANVSMGQQQRYVFCL